MSDSKKISKDEKETLLAVLKDRFEKNMERHSNISWDDVSAGLEKNEDKLWSLNEMEKTGGEPDVIDFINSGGGFVFCDCAPESPVDRRSLCYDDEALEARKKNKPRGSVAGRAKDMGIEMLDEETYKKLQGIGEFDLKTSSWIATPDKIRGLGGSLFCDRRFDHVFTYHNSADSYYSSRGFRGLLKI